MLAFLQVGGDQEHFPPRVISDQSVALTGLTTAVPSLCRQLSRQVGAARNSLPSKLMSALGQKQTYAPQKAMSAMGNCTAKERF
jgi:hypothetical protein